METASLLDRVVQTLEQRPNYIRAKKLILCICRDVWENDPDQLSQVSLKDLIQELVELNSNFEALKLSFSNIVKTLNKKAEYALIANTILASIKPLYPESAQLDDRDDPDDLYNELSDRLQAEPELDRMKKLLFSACGYAWENEVAKIDQFKLSALIRTVHEIHPTLQELNRTLSKMVSTLNKQQEYAAIASTILDRFSLLYPDRSESTRVVSDSDAAVSDPAMQSPPPAPSAVLDGANPANEQALANFPPIPPAKIPFSRRTFDPFELRISTIRYANPLRVKILAFSVLEQVFTFSDRDWLSLRDRQIDDLLQELFFSHETLEQLEATLKQAAQEFADSSEYLQVVSVLSRVLKPLYETRSQTLEIANPAATSG